MTIIMGDDSSLQDFSSRRHFQRFKKVSNEANDDEEASPLSPSPGLSSVDEENKKNKHAVDRASPPPPSKAPLTTKKKIQAATASKLRSVLSAFNRSRPSSNPQLGLGSRVVGTLFGNRGSHVHFAFQRDPTSPPEFLVELATPIRGLLREMASGLVRIALKCDKVEEGKNEDMAVRGRRRLPLLQEPRWRTYCNGKKYGFAARRECGEKEWTVLRAVEPISMGAGALPAAAKKGEEEEADKNLGGGGDGEVMYMRAKFERVVGSRDSEAFYMMNPDNNAAPELSVYLLRV